MQWSSAEGQACCLETKRSPPTTEITQTRCDICSSAVAASRTGAWRGTLLSGCSEKEPQSKYGQFQSHIAFCHALLTQPWHHKLWNNMHLISLNLVYLKWNFLLQRVKWKDLQRWESKICVVGETLLKIIIKSEFGLEDEEKTKISIYDEPKVVREKQVNNSI